MSDGDEFDREWADHDLLAKLNNLEGDLGCARLAQPARFHKSCREAGHVDGHAKVRPKLGEGAYMVFVCMSDDHPDQIPLRLLDEAEIRHDEIDARQVLVGEADADVDHQPLAGGGARHTLKGGNTRA